MDRWICHRFAKNADFEEVDLTDPRESRKTETSRKANVHFEIVFPENVKNVADFAKEVTKPLFQKPIMRYFLVG